MFPDILVTCVKVYYCKIASIVMLPGWSRVCKDAYRSNHLGVKPLRLKLWDDQDALERLRIVAIILLMIHPVP